MIRAILVKLAGKVVKKFADRSTLDDIYLNSMIWREDQREKVNHAISTIADA